MPTKSTSNPEAGEYRVERLSQERLRDVEALYESVYSKKAAPNYFITKYNTAYTGVEYVGYVAYNIANTPVAYYGVVPCYLQNGKEKFLSAQSADTMTHPGFRFKGMFVELSNLTFELCKKLNIRLIFGFPNQNSYHGAVHKLGWKFIHEMTCFMIPVKTIPIARISYRWAATRKLYSFYSALVTGKTNFSTALIPNSSIENGFVSVLRDKNYERSKDYFKRQVLTIAKGLVWCKITDQLIIGDVLIMETDFPLLMNRLVRLARMLGLSRIQFHTSPGTTLHKLFSVRYSEQPSFPALVQDFESGLPLEKIKFTLADIDIF